MADKAPLFRGAFCVLGAPEPRINARNLKIIKKYSKKCLQKKSWIARLSPPQVSEQPKKYKYKLKKHENEHTIYWTSSRLRNRSKW